MKKDARAVTKAAVMRRALELKVRIEEGGLSEKWIQATAPDGYRFRSTDLHSVVAPYWPDFGDPKGGAWAAILDDMKEGIEKCDPECDVCYG